MSVDLTDEELLEEERRNSLYPGLEASWARVNLTRVLDGDREPTRPTILRSDGGGAFFYLGHVCGLHADSGIGKTFVAATALAEQLVDGHHVLLVDLEEPTADTIVDRLRLLGVADDVIDERLHYHAPTDAFTDVAVEYLVHDIEEHGITLVVIDSLGEAFGLDGIDENKDAEVGPWLRRVARRLADAGPCVLLIDHATKAADSPLHPSGSKRKRAAITGASYLVEAPKPLTLECGGRLTLTCAKDRHGYYRRGQVVAHIDFTMYPDGGMTVHVWPVTTRTDSAEEKLRVVARAAVQAAKEAGRPLSQRELVESMNVKARAELKRAAIDYALGVGALRTEDGPRRAVLHAFVRDLETS